MKIQSLKLVCFSPTGTTKSIIRAIASGMNQNTAELIDITCPNVRKQQLRISENELLIVAVPVYVGRVPAILLDWLHTIKARNTPAVCIVVYGNREYGDALMELKVILANRGCLPIACAAYIGEHSFSSSETPIAADRPDKTDLLHAESFGRKINQKLVSISSVKHISNINVLGSYPTREAEALLSVDFMDINDTCAQCGVCAQRCPVGAIDTGDPSSNDKGKCILCCACIKNCPQNARTMKPSMVKDIAIHLSKMCKKRKEPVFFI
jgi:ferredoxin